jgi:hypothetical protein
MAQKESLSLFSLSEKNYLNLLSKAAFINTKTEDQGKNYAKYNKQISKRLLNQEIKDSFIQRFGSQKLKDAVKGYQLIAQAIETGELRVMQFIPVKP